MIREAYLTIDDSPSTRTDDILTYLNERGIQALFFCRGDLLEENPVMAAKIVEAGHVLGNHAFHHRRASKISYEEMVTEIEKTESLIEQVYTMALRERPGKYFRFPHLDRGCGGQVIDFDKLPQEDKKVATATFTEGLNVINMSATKAATEKKEKLQAYLKERGFTVPFKDVSPSWYRCDEIEQAADCLFTFSNCDWMLSRKHQGKWRFKTLEDLKAKVQSDPNLKPAESVNVILAHDQAEIIDVSLATIDWMLENEIRFREIE